MSTIPKHRVGGVVARKLPFISFFLLGVLVMATMSTLRGSDAASRQHVYELRLYHVKDGKMDALIARFRDHTDAIFQRHNMKAIGYWQPQDPSDSKNLLVYMLEHPSREEAQKN